MVFGNVVDRLHVLDPVACIESFDQFPSVFLPWFLDCFTIFLVQWKVISNHFVINETLDIKFLVQNMIDDKVNLPCIERHEKVFCIAFKVNHAIIVT